MKFACEHCGRGYAVADELRGKTFKMKCKACGHLIVVKGSHSDPPGRARGTSGKAEPTPSPVTIAGGPHGDEPLARPPSIPEVNPFVARPVSAATLGSHDAAARRDSSDDAGLPPPPTEQYIDLVIDEEKAGAAEARERELPPPRPPPRRDGPGVHDPFAGWKPLGEPEVGPLAEPVEPHPARPPREPAGAREAPPKPRREPWAEPKPLPAPAPEGLNPKVLIVAGGVAVAAVAVLLFVFVGRGGQAPGPAVPVAAQPAPLAVPSAPVAAQPRPVPPPAAVEPVPAVAEPEPAREEEPPRRREPAQRKPKPVKVAREERRPEPRPEPPRRAPQPAPEPPPEPPPRPAPSAPTATPSASAAQPKAAAQLTPQQIGRIVTANKRAFEQCIAEAGKRDPGLDLAGRQVTLMLTVNPNGKVAYPTIDDVELNKTDLGACIKAAARTMMFPTFEGDPMKVEVPLTLGR